MARPNWEYVRVDVLLPDNPKLDGLSPSAKWTLIELWCYCGQHLTDGFVRQAKWVKFGAKRDRDALVAAGLAVPADGGWQMHDYLSHQRSRQEVTDLKEKRRKAGEKGGKAKASATAEAKHVPEQTPEHVPKQTAGKPVAEAEADLSPADVVDQSSRRNARDDETDLIINEIKQVTGQTIDFRWAARIRLMLLGDRSVDDPAAYLRQAIRAERDPRKRFLPSDNLPSSRPLAEALRVAGINPGHRPASEATIATAAAEARRALGR